jgi:hypothetical protein
LLAFLRSIALIIGFFLIGELLDRTFRDKIRTERLTKSKLLGAFPNPPKLKYRNYQTVYNLISTKYLSSAILRYFTSKPEGKPFIVNFLSNDTGEGKIFIAKMLEAYWLQLGLSEET